LTIRSAIGGSAVSEILTVHAGKLMGQVTNFTIVGAIAKHCVDQYMVLFRYYSLEGDTAMPGGLHVRFCHAFLVFFLKRVRCGWSQPWRTTYCGSGCAERVITSICDFYDSVRVCPRSKIKMT